MDNWIILQVPLKKKEKFREKAEVLGCKLEVKASEEYLIFQDYVLPSENIKIPKIYELIVYDMHNFLNRKPPKL